MFCGSHTQASNIATLCLHQAPLVQGQLQRAWAACWRMKASVNVGKESITFPFLWPPCPYGNLDAKTEVGRGIEVL